MRRTTGIAVAAAAAMAVGGGTATAAGAHAAAHAKSGEQTFTATEAGTQLSTTGLRFEDTFKIKGGSFGYGSAIRDFVLTGTKFPVSGKDAAVSWFRDGRLTSAETVTLGVPSFDGVGAVSGTGTCVSGTYKHQGETCTYKIAGSYDLITGRMFLTLHGTDTPSSTATKKK